MAWESFMRVDDSKSRAQIHLLSKVEFLWGPLLVESNSDDPVNYRLAERIIHPDSVLKHSSQWEHADILIFNSCLWWRQGLVKLLWSFEENGACEELDGLALDVSVERVEDVLTRNRLLHLAENPANRLVFEVRILQVYPVSTAHSIAYYIDYVHSDSMNEDAQTSTHRLPLVHGVEKIVDLATLVGACIVALGPSIAGKRGI
ncbi:hypothetical protein CRYUN_Cryun08bG0085800 [Craigia yunnanensis]